MQTKKVNKSREEPQGGREGGKEREREGARERERERERERASGVDNESLEDTPV